jgi:hypothetical protein
MKVGDLVRSKPMYFCTGEEDWVGIIIEFKTLVDHFGEPLERYAIVRWNNKFHEEEEYQNSLEVISESR